MRKEKGVLLLMIALPVLLLAAILADLRIGSISITFPELFSAISGRNDLDEQQLLILTHFRLPRVTAALLVGASLPVCGLQMQTLFRNPLAGPYVLGISSGASFGAALVVMGGSAVGLIAPWNLALAAWAGAGMVMILLLLVSFRIRDGITLLILGLMFSSALAAIISIMQYFSQASALKSFVIWSMGSLGNVSGDQLRLMILVIVPLLALSMMLPKTLNGLLLGENYARTMGISIRWSRTIILALTSILAGTVTAFCGPVGFIGIAVPHIARFLFGRSDHRILLPATLLTGMLVMVISDIVSQLPGSDRVLPINAVTSLIGIPVVIALVLVNRQKMRL